MDVYLACVPVPVHCVPGWRRLLETTGGCRIPGTGVADSVSLLWVRGIELNHCAFFPAHAPLFLKTFSDIEDRMVGTWAGRETFLSEFWAFLVSFSMWLEGVKAFKSTSCTRRGEVTERWEQRRKWNWKYLFFCPVSSLFCGAGNCNVRSWVLLRRGNLVSYKIHLTERGFLVSLFPASCCSWYT